MRLLDEQYTRTPFYGVLKMTAWLCESGHPVNCKRVRRLLRLMGLEAIYPKPRLSLAAPGHQIYPYLLRGAKITRVNQVWSADITLFQMSGRRFQPCFSLLRKIAPRPRQEWPLQDGGTSPSRECSGLPRRSGRSVRPVSPLLHGENACARFVPSSA